MDLWLAPDITTGQWWEWSSLRMSPEGVRRWWLLLDRQDVIDTLEGMSGHALFEAAQEHELIADDIAAPLVIPPESREQLITALLIRLGDKQVSVASVSDETLAELRSLLETISGVLEAERSSGCECPKCAGVVDDCAWCLYAGLSDTATLEWIRYQAGIQEWWNIPLRLWQIDRLRAAVEQRAKLQAMRGGDSPGADYSPRRQAARERAWSRHPEI